VTVKDATARLLDPGAAKAVVECQKQIAAAGAKLFGGVLKGVDGCGRSLLACARTVDATKRAKCEAKAGASCTQEIAKIAATKDALAAAVPAKCGAVSFADAASDAGLGHGDGEVSAACGGPLDGFAALGACLGSRHACAAAEIASRVLPGVRALMTDAGVASEGLDALPCLADDAGGVDPATARLVAPCAKAAGKAASKLAGTVYKSLAKCHETVLACVEQKPGDAKCRAKAGKTCTGLVAKIADGEAALEDAVVGTCTDAAVAALAGGTGSGTLGSECEAVGATPDSVSAYATCLARSAVCAAEDVVALAAPRSVATLGLGGVTFGSAFCAAP
jgi:hypothetical protein